jgi:transcription initiation factor TFIIIB Brf1 subunit/transcription initiation factor TFIIB
VEEICPECSGTVVENRGIYYCRRCGFVVGVELVFDSAPQRAQTWTGRILQSVEKSSDGISAMLKRRASYIAVKLQKKYHVGQNVAAVAGLIAAQEELGIQPRVKAPKSTVRNAKAVLRKAKGKLYSPMKRADIFADRLFEKCLELGIPPGPAMEIYNRHRDLLGSLKPSTVAFAVGYLLGMKLPKRRTAKRVARILELAESTRTNTSGADLDHKRSEETGR